MADFSESSMSSSSEPTERCGAEGRGATFKPKALAVGGAMLIPENPRERGHRKFG